MLPVPGHGDGVLDNPGVTVSVAYEERLCVLAYGNCCGFTVMAEKYKNRSFIFKENLS